MKNILDRIIAHKRRELEETKQKFTVRDFEKSAYFERDCFKLSKTLTDPQKTGIIAEFKRKSPSKGIINQEAQVEEVTATYEQNDASGLSILTNTEFFQGFPEDITKARKANIPILRKEFIVDEYQILEAKALGADVILLIAECLTTQEVKGLTGFAQSLGLEVLLELHSSQQLGKIAASNNLIGINNRDLTTFKVDIDRSIELSHLLPKESLKIAESGISDPKVMSQMKGAGFNGFLMGEHFMKNPRPGEAFKKFVKAVKLIEHEV